MSIFYVVIFIKCNVQNKYSKKNIIATLIQA